MCSVAVTTPYAGKILHRVSSEYGAKSFAKVDEGHHRWYFPDCDYFYDSADLCGSTWYLAQCMIILLQILLTLESQTYISIIAWAANVS